MAEKTHRSRIEMAVQNPRPYVYPLGYSTGYTSRDQDYANKEQHTFKNDQQVIPAGGQPQIIFSASIYTRFWHMTNIGCDTVWIHYGFPDAWIGQTTDKSNQEQELEYNFPERAKEDSGIGRGIPLYPGGTLTGDHHFDVWGFSEKGSLISYAYMG